MRNLHSIDHCDPRNKHKKCVVYWLVGLGLGFVVLCILTFASAASTWFRTIMLIFLVLTFAALGFWGYKLVFAKKKHNKNLVLRRRKLREYLQQCNTMIESRGLHWTPSPRLSYIVLRTNYKPLGRDLEDYRAQFIRDEVHNQSRINPTTMLSDFQQLKKLSDIDQARNHRAADYLDDSNVGMLPQEPSQFRFQNLQKPDTGSIKYIDKENLTPIRIRKQGEKNSINMASAKPGPNMISSGSGYSKGEFSRDNSPNIKQVFSNRRAENLRSAENLAYDNNSLEDSHYHDSPQVVEVKDLLRPSTNLNPFGDYSPSGKKIGFTPRNDPVLDEESTPFKKNPTEKLFKERTSQIKMMPWDDLKSPTKSRQDTPMKNQQLNQSQGGSPIMLQTKEISNIQNIQGYTSHNPYDSYIPDDSLAGNSRSGNFFGYGNPQNQNTSVINRNPSQTYQLTQFDDYSSTIEKGPKSAYQIGGPSINQGIVGKNSSSSFLNRLEKASDGGFLKVGSNQTFQAHESENRAQNFQDASVSYGRTYLNKAGGRSTRSRVNIVSEQP